MYNTIPPHPTNYYQITPLNKITIHYYFKVKSFAYPHCRSSVQPLFLSCPLGCLIHTQLSSICKILNVKYELPIHWAYTRHTYHITVTITQLKTSLILPFMIAIIVQHCCKRGTPQNSTYLHTPFCANSTGTHAKSRVSIAILYHKYVVKKYQPLS